MQFAVPGIVVRQPRTFNQKGIFLTWCVAGLISALSYADNFILQFFFKSAFHV